MILFERIVYKLRSYTSRLFRTKINREMKERLNKQDISIISSNCIGGILSHDLGLRFNSPTINLYFDAEDYIKFLENLEHYISISFKSFDTKNCLYPIGILDDIKIHFVHYLSVEECIEKWNIRKSRIIKDKIYVICTDRNGMNKNLLNRFCALPYKKILFTNKKNWVNKYVIYIPVFKNEECVGELNKFADFKGNRYYEKYFDIIGWINGGE